MGSEQRLPEAVRLLSDGRYLEAQEAFEALWRIAEGGDRHWYQGWALLAAALFHRDRGNARGASQCYERARTHWAGLTPPGDGLDLAAVLAAVAGVLGTEWAPPPLPWPALERRQRPRGREVER